MALMTACPHCKTHFKIVADQLRLHNGWVRCGTCNGVFDASKHLRPLPPEPPQPLTEPIPPAWEQKPAVQALMNSTAAGNEAHNHKYAPKKASVVANMPKQNATPASPPASTPVRPTPPSQPVDSPDDFDTEMPFSKIGDTGVFFEGRFNFTDNANSADNPNDRPPDLPKFTRATTKGFKTLGRLLGYTLAAALCVMAVAQSAVLLRYTLANAAPASKPALEALCKVLMCTVEPALVIEPLVLEVLTLKRTTDNDDLSQAASYELVANIRNHSNLTVYKPQLELTLTNAQSQVIARRVLSLTELEPNAAPQNNTIAPQQDWNLKQTLLLSPQTVGFSGRLVIVDTTF